MKPELSEQEQTLNKAMNLFWQQGAEVASYNDLVKVTGLSRKSLYAQWPDKDALIRGTLGVYHSQLLEFITGLMEPSGLIGLQSFWDGFEEIAQRDTWRGCYLYRTAGGPLRDRSYVVEIYGKYMHEFSNAVAKHIQRGQDKGDISLEIGAKSAGLISFSLVGTMSAIGAQSGYDGRVAELFHAARGICGIQKLA